MKTKNFGERILNVWAAIVKNAAPNHCVKCLTLKNKKNAEKYLLGAKNELKLIDKLKLSDADIAARLWSHQTKVELLKRGCEALLSEVKTEEEFDAVVAQGSSLSLIKAARVYTPSRAKVKELCATRSPLTIKALAKEVPAVFDALTAAEVLGAKEDELIPATYERWGVATILAKAKPSWAPVFLKKLVDIVPSQLGEEGKDLMTLFFNIAFAAKLDVSGMMPYFFVYRPERYAKVRDNLLSYKEVAPYFNVIFPQMQKFLHKDVSYDSIDDINLKGELKPEEEVYAWLKIGYMRLSELRVYSYFLENMWQIKAHILPRLYNELFGEMIGMAPDYLALKTLYRLAGDDVLNTEIPSKLVAGMEKKMPGATLRFAFPFKGWKENLVTRAIKAMIAKQEFLVEKIAEFSPEMQQVAVEAMETKSQIAAIDKGAVAQLVENVKLYPEAERYLLSRSLMAKYQNAYLQRVQIDASTFTWMLKTKDLSLMHKEQYLFSYAQKWGLSQEQYLQVMQSSLADRAPFLKNFVK